MCYIQLPNRPTNFKTIFIKPYFRPKTIHNNKLDKPDKPETPLLISELTIEPTKPTKPTIPPLIKHSQGRPQKHPVTENHLTSIDTPVKQPPSTDILVLV
jgi:hypothetical protein